MTPPPGSRVARVPLPRLDKGDNVVIENIWYEEVSRDAASITLKPVGQSQGTVTLSADRIRQLHYEDRTLRIQRRAHVPLDPAHAEARRRALESFPQEAQEAALRLYDYCLCCDRVFAARRLPKVVPSFERIARIVAWHRRRQQAARQDRPVPARSLPLEKIGGTTLRNHYTEWVKMGRNITALAPLHHLKGSPREPIDPAVELLIAQHVRERYLTLERLPVTIVHDGICHAVQQLNEGRDKPLPPPTEKAVRRWIKENIDDDELVLGREGPDAAANEFRMVHRAPKSTMPLGIVEVDHTPLDIILVNPNGAPAGKRRKGESPAVAGRAWLTLIICTATRMVVGWYIGMERPNWGSVMHALRVAVLPKDPARVGAHSPNPVHGVPWVVKLDNGKEFHALSLQAAAGQLHFELRYTPKKKPHLKGIVERFFREVNHDFVAPFPGRTFANVRERGDYDSKGHARMTLEKARELFELWVTDIYHNRPHRGLMGLTPLQKWNELAQFGVRFAPSADDLDALLAQVVDRKIQRTGIHFLGLTYQSRALQALRRRGGHRNRDFAVKVDLLDMRRALVLDDVNGRWIEALCTDLKLVEGLGLRDWREVTRLARQMTREGQRVSRRIVLAARERLLSEGDAMRAGRPRPTQADVEWLMSHVDDVVFELAPDPADGADAPPSERPAGRDSLPVSEAGGVPLPEVELDDEGQVRKAPPPSRATQADADAMLAEVLAQAAESRRRERALNPDDPDNWSFEE